MYKTAKLQIYQFAITFLLSNAYQETSAVGANGANDGQLTLMAVMQVMEGNGTRRTWPVTSMALNIASFSF